MINNIALRKKLGDILAKSDAEKEWWERRRETIRTDFMKEIDADGKSQAKS